MLSSLCLYIGFNLYIDRVYVKITVKQAGKAVEEKRRRQSKGELTDTLIQQNRTSNAQSMYFSAHESYSPDNDSVEDTKRRQKQKAMEELYPIIKKATIARIFFLFLIGIVFEFIALGFAAMTQVLPMHRSLYFVWMQLGDFLKFIRTKKLQ